MQDILNLLKPLLGEPNVNKDYVLRWCRGWGKPSLSIEKCESTFGESFTYILEMDNAKGTSSRHELRGEGYLSYILMLLPSIKWIMNDGNL